MLKINIQLFAHKKGMGSTKNGRDSESKRLGAKRADIKIQFVIEAMTTSLIGGILGIVVGVVSAQNVGPLLEINAVPSFGSVALSVGISVFIGVLFGYLPAKKASELNPIDALRHE